jgi:hypothetical protein
MATPDLDTENIDVFPTLLSKMVQLEAMLSVSLNIQSDLLARQEQRDPLAVRQETWERVSLATEQLVESLGKRARSNE